MICLAKKEKVLDLIEALRGLSRCLDGETSPSDVELLSGIVTDMICPPLIRLEILAHTANLVYSWEALRVMVERARRDVASSIESNCVTVGKDIGNG